MSFTRLPIFSLSLRVGTIASAVSIEFSLKGKEIRKFKNILDSTYRLLGKKEFFRNKSEKGSLQFRRSIFAVKDIKKGEKFTKYNVRSIRPGFGLSPIYYEKLLRTKSKTNILKGEPIKKRNINKNLI